MTKRNMYGLIAACAFLVLSTLLFYIYLVPKRPQPMYGVGTYSELLTGIRSNAKLLTPPVSTIRIDDYAYTIYLKSRFSNEPIGYAIHKKLTAMDSLVIDDISCRERSHNPSYQIRADDTVKGIGIKIEQYSDSGTVIFSFLHNDYIYSLESSAPYETAHQEAMAIINGILAAEIDYRSFIKIKAGTLKIYKEKSNTIGNLIFDEALMSFRFENVTDQAFDFNVQVLYNPEFASKYTESGHSRIIPDAGSPIRLLPGKGLTCEAGFTVCHYNALTQDEQKEFDRLKSIFIIEMRIDSKRFSVRLDLKDLPPDS